MILLSVTLFLPLVGFLVLLLTPRNKPQAVRAIALGTAVAAFVCSVALLGLYNRDEAGFQLAANWPWIDTPAIRFHIGIDGLSVWLVLLTTLLTPISILVSWRPIATRVKEFYLFFLLMEFGLIGVFIALDLFLFYVFWEVSLVPMYFLIGVWGHERRVYAAVKFFIYTTVGSLMMLAAIIYLYTRTGTFDYTALIAMTASGQLALTGLEEALLFGAFFLAFAIKVPLFPLHTWLPDAHVEAPTAGSVMLASVMLKMGCYGLIRFCLPLFPRASHEYAPWIVALAITGIIYGALVALVQPNMKKLVAYTSVSHLGFVILGIFTFTQYGLDGAVYQMLNHGISTGALFVLVGYLYERRHSLEIADYGGVAAVAPWLAIAFSVTSLASMGLPALNNFVGEYLIMQGTAFVSMRWTALAAVGVILSAAYLLWLYQRVFYGDTPEAVRAHVTDMVPREWAAIVPLIVMMVWMGVYSTSFLPPISRTTADILDRTHVGVVVRVQNTMPAAEVADAR